MGITKRPASSCSDEIIAVEIEDNSDGFSDTISDNTENPGDIVLEDPLQYFEFLENNEPYDIDEPELLYQVHFKDETSFPDEIQQVKQLFKKKISKMGRRKANRAQNEIFLLSLSDNCSSEDTIFYNDNKNGFTNVFKHCSHHTLKESFLEGQEDILLKKKKRNMNYEKKRKRITQPEIAFKNLTTSQKSLFKQKSLPFTTINDLETEVVQYFTFSPNGVYTSVPLPSYHRLLLHGIVRYYSLDATSVNSRGQRSQKIVQVKNNHYDDFKPPRLSLLKFIETKLNKIKISHL
ncbi:R3H domain-containing protein 4-like [Daktulosphaira vitifoliae]|uniref:R3H domain-containing protein 4-like n=1 Tax=Daktulosphaira vitifoliae TaxID=58002 RepID=UPI0021A98C12|nr:R3H domain-containing protein 4-like [Daktulosphaira vitifoliae]XP_050529532.1 R3H domain-containing protein 4-like [Daktulosphaira vitifoliae]